MTDSETNHRLRMSELLPWYVNGTLGDEDTMAVEAMLGRDPSLRSELEVVQDEQLQLLALVNAEHVPPTMQQRFNAQLNREPAMRSTDQRDGMQLSRPSWLSFLNKFLPTATSKGFAMAAMVLLLMQPISLVLWSGGVSTIDQVASKDGGAETLYNSAIRAFHEPSSVKIAVQINPQLSLEALTRFLSENRAQLVSGDSRILGGFKIKVEKTSEENDEAVLMRIRQNAGVVLSANSLNLLEPRKMSTTQNNF